jgi:hypothetical protein
VAAAGYRDIEITPEDTQLLAMRIQRAIHDRAWALADKTRNPVVLTPIYLSVLEEMTDEERAELRKKIDFKPVPLERYDI